MHTAFAAGTATAYLLGNEPSCRNLDAAAISLGPTYIAMAKPFAMTTL